MIILKRHYSGLYKNILILKLISIKNNKPKKNLKNSEKTKVPSDVTKLPAKKKKNKNCNL